jgi:pimeloyl-ACP methyl ester carboxylesterase
VKESHFTESFDGAPIAYRIYGEGSPSVLLTNGIGCNQAYVDHLVRALAMHHRVVIWDYRGHVDSPAHADPRQVTIDCCLSDMHAVVEAAGLQQMVLAGFSMGVQISLEYHHRHPGRTLGLLALLGTYEYPLRSFYNLGRFSEGLVGLMHRLAARAPGPMGKVWSAALSGPWTFPIAKYLVLNPKAARADDFESWREHLAGVHPQTFLQLGIYLGRHSAAHVLPSLSVPSLVVAGDRDYFTPLKVCRRMHEQIPGSEWFQVKGGSHGGLFEFPDLINTRVLDFMERHFSAAP